MKSIAVPKLKEFVGNQKKLELLKRCIIDKTPALVWGNPGIGKTSSVYAIALELNLAIIEFNSSDERDKESLDNIRRIARSTGFKDYLILLDEVDGLRNETLLCEILKHSTHSIVLTANEAHRIPKKVKDLCKEIRFYQPNISDVLERVKVVAESHGIRPKFENISRDVRSSLITTVYGGEKHKNESDFDKVIQIFKGEPTENIDQSILIWLMDNASQFYWGKDLYDVIQLIALADRTKQMELLSLLPKGGYAQPKYPYYFRQISQLRKQKVTLKKQRGAKKK